MKRLALVAAFVLAGCASKPSAEALAMKYYMDTQRPLAGKSLSWSAYYEGLHNHAAAAGFPGEMLLQFNEAIRLAKDLEAGRITQEQFDDRRRDLNARTTSTQERLVAREQAQKAAASAAAAQQLAATAQIMAASAPRPAYVAPAPVATAPNTVLVGFLNSQSINGSLRYCNYTNGVVTTIAITSLCPLDTQ